MIERLFYYGGILTIPWIQPGPRAIKGQHVDVLSSLSWPNIYASHNGIRFCVAQKNSNPFAERPEFIVCVFGATVAQNSRAQHLNTPFYCVSSVFYRRFQSRDMDVAVKDLVKLLSFVTKTLPPDSS